MKTAIAVLLTCWTALTSGQELQTHFEKSRGKQSPGYYETIDFYRHLDKISPRLLLKEMGMSDAGLPLHLALYANNGRFDPATWRQQNKIVVLVINGIHPGEPDGIDASMILLRDLVSGRKRIPDNICLAFIPVYNIGGLLNRSTHYRVNQNGPENPGFRGNSQNLDLNRDFIKSDTKEARSFAHLFHYLEPDILVDNHVSNGADYQHIMTLICSQHSKLGGALGDFMNRRFEPGLYELMRKKGYDLVPYVNFHGGTPDQGWPAFFDNPRYSSGYATLWNSFGFTTETHMLKPYPLRVAATVAMMESFIVFGSANQDTIKLLRRQARRALREQHAFDLSWQLDSGRSAPIVLKGFKAANKASAVSSLPRLYYDRNQPFAKEVPFFNYYKADVTVKKPLAYIIPAGWWRVIDLLALNRVKMQQLKADTSMQVEVYHIAGYQSSTSPYEGHHVNTQVEVKVSQEALLCRKGDWYIPMKQDANRFLAEVLEPQATDSYFAWNFFDAILTRKEGYSDYVFEDTAEQYLRDHPEVQALLEAKKTSDTAFARKRSGAA